MLHAQYLSTLVIVTDTNGALVGETVSPEAADLDVDLRGTAVGEKQPSAEDWLGEDVQNGVGDDLLVDVGLTAAISHTPDAATDIRCCRFEQATTELTLGRQSKG